MELRIARDLIFELRIKLKSIRISLKGPTDVYCNNQEVMKKSVTKSTLNKKHKSINYHVVCEAAASGILLIGKEDTATNLAEPLTKLVP